MEIHNHFVIAVVLHATVCAQRISSNTILPEGLLFLTFWPLSRKSKEKLSLRSLRLCGEINLWIETNTV